MNDLGSLDVDIIIDEGPDTVNLQGDAMQVLQSLGPQFLQQFPEIAITLAPLPASVKKPMLDTIAQQKNARQAAGSEIVGDPGQGADSTLPTAQQDAALAQQKDQREAMQAQQDAALKQQQAVFDEQARQREAQQEMMIERMRAENEASIERMRATLEMQLERIQAASSMRIEQERHEHDMTMDRERAENAPAPAQ